MQTQPDGIHTIPVPRGMTVQEAWANIKQGALLLDADPDWTNIEVRDGELHLILGKLANPEPHGNLLAMVEELHTRIAACKQHPHMRDPAYEQVWIGLCDAADGVHRALDKWPA